tara:strand:+ start:286 stop:582 length:297 start_codon:yes stop_codon:yes gene_type:complete
MRFLEIINEKKFILISISLFIYIMINLFEGQRGIISYYKNIKIKNELIDKKNEIAANLLSIEKKNMLLTDNIDLDYLEIIYREKFMVGKSSEYIYKSN